MTAGQLLAALVAANVLGAAIYESGRWLVVWAWRRQTSARRRRENLINFRQSLVGNRQPCGRCGRPLLEHLAVQNDVGCYAECPDRIAAQVAARWN